MPNPYTGSNISGCNSPALGADKSTYSGVMDTMAQKVDEHDHTSTKGKQIPTAGIVDEAITEPKLADEAVSTRAIEDEAVTLAKLAAATITSLLPPGMVIPYASAGSAPSGWLVCDGTSLLRASYPDLFAAIGTIHGAADASHFNLPDYRGRFLRGHANGQATDPDRASRTAMNTGGATGDNVGSVQSDQFGSHNHGGGSHSHSTSTAYVTGITLTAGSAGGGGGPGFSTDGPSGTSTGVNSSGTINSTEGGNETRPENAYVQYLIKT